MATSDVVADRNQTVTPEVGMGSHHSAEQVAQRYVDAMGPQLGKVFHRLWNECVWLHWEWDEYVQLFGTNQRRLDLLNETAPALFTIVQECLWEAVLLHLARLTDPITVAGKETLTLHRLRPLVKPPFRETVQQHLDDVTNKTKFARDWRNRHIGHRELSLALQDSAKPLEPASRQAVSEAIAAVAILLNAVESHYCQSEVAYKYSTPFGNAEALLHSLRAAQHAIAKRDRRFEEGDWNPPEWEREPV